jgi:hypothetical protein
MVAGKPPSVLGLGLPQLRQAVTGELTQPVGIGRRPGSRWQNEAVAKENPMRFPASEFSRGAAARSMLACAALALGVTVRPALAQDQNAALTALIDRAQIEDMLVDYYANLGGADRGFGSYYTADGVLDVNGIVGRGKSGIEDLYKRTAAGTPRPGGTFHMLLTNIKIVARGETATADCLWTGVRSVTPKATPQFVEQGREHDELVKRDGHWYFQHRVITSDGGLPAMFERTYQKR